MNRRIFLFASAAAAVDPERLLWVPGAKKYFIPAPPRMTVEQYLNQVYEHAWYEMDRYLLGHTRIPDRSVLCDAVGHILRDAERNLQINYFSHVAGQA